MKTKIIIRGLNQKYSAISIVSGEEKQYYKLSIKKTKILYSVATIFSSEVPLYNRSGMVIELPQSQYLFEKLNSLAKNLYVN